MKKEHWQFALRTLILWVGIGLYSLALRGDFPWWVCILGGLIIIIAIILIQSHGENTANKKWADILDKYLPPKPHNGR